MDTLLEREKALLKSQAKAQELINNGLSMINEANRKGPKDSSYGTNMNLGTSLLNTGNDKLISINAELFDIKSKMKRPKKDNM